MRWLLDTNVCIRYLNGRSPKLKTRFEQADEREIAVCSVVRAELLFGAAKSRDAQTATIKQELFLSRFASYPFDDSCAEAYANVRRDLESAGTPIGPNDLLIASIALTNSLTLVTHNTAEFNRIAGLSIEDWEE